MTMIQPAQPTPDPKTSAAARKARSRRVGGWLLVGLVLLGHTWQATRLWPTWRSIVDPTTPVVIVDHAIHEYHGGLGASFLRATGTTWGYDPFFMAGYPETPVWDSSSNLAIAFNILGNETTSFRAYKVGLFLVSVLGLVALMLGAGVAGLSLVEVAVAGFLASVYFWVGYPIALWRSGLFAFLSAAIGSSLLLGLCVRFDRQPSRWCWVALTVVAAGLFFIHVTTPIMVGGGALAFYLLVARRHHRRWHAAIGGAVALTILANLIWLGPLWRFRSLRVGSGFFMTTDSARFLLDYYLSPSLDSRTGLILIVLGSIGLTTWWFAGRRTAAMAFGGSILALILLTGFGSLWEPTKVMEPLRFRVAFCYLLTLPTASLLVAASSRLARLLGGGRVGPVLTALVWVVVLGSWGWLDRAYWQAAGSWLAYRRPLAVGYPLEARPLIDWIKRETDLSARILFEDQLRLLEPTDAESTHWTPLLPTLLADDPRLFIGGLYQTAFIQHHQRASFGDFQLGGRPIDEWTPAEIARYADQYNLGWVVCWSPLSRFVFDRLPGATRVATIPRHATFGRPPANNEHERSTIFARAGVAVARRYILEGESSYAVYRLDRGHSYFLRGRGRITHVTPNRVELADVEPDAEGVVVVSLHWLDSWTTEPPASIRPAASWLDPVPLLRITTSRPIPRLILTNGGENFLPEPHRPAG